MVAVRSKALEMPVATIPMRVMSVGMFDNHCNLHLGTNLGMRQGTGMDRDDQRKSINTTDPIHVIIPKSPNYRKLRF